MSTELADLKVKEGDAEDPDNDDAVEEDDEVPEMKKSPARSPPKKMSLLQKGFSFLTQKHKDKGDAALDEQAQMAHDPTSIWNAVLAPDAERCATFELADWEQFGPVGDTPFLLLFLYNGDDHMAIAKSLLKRWPILVFSKYHLPETAPLNLYEGETALHLAVINKRTEIVDLLMSVEKKYKRENPEEKRALLDMPATGLFFSLGDISKLSSNCYYGGVPLGFAACTHNLVMFDQLLSYGADLYFRDGLGNNLQHLMVLYDNVDMSLFIQQKEEAWHKAVEDRNRKKDEASKRSRVTVHGPLDANEDDDELEGADDLDPPVFGGVVDHSSPKDGIAPFGARTELTDGEQKALKARRYRLDFRLNDAGHSPLMLAASNGMYDMFDRMVQATKTTQWTYGPVRSDCYPLKELDTIDPDDDEPGKSCCPCGPKVDGTHKNKEGEDEEVEKEGKNVLNVLVDNGHLRLLMHPTIVRLLNVKWNTYVGRRYSFRCLQQVLLVASLTLAVILGFPNQSVYSLATTEAAVKTVFRCLFEVVVVIVAFYKGFSEFGEFISAPREYYAQSGVAFLENLISSIYTITIFVNVCLRIVGIAVGGDLSIDLLFLATSLFLAWLYALTLLLGFHLTGPFVIMIYKMMVQDVMKFCIIYFVMLLGFASAFFVLEGPPEDGASGAKVFWDRVHALFMVMMGDIDFEAFTETARTDLGQLVPVISNLLLLFHVLVITIMLLNLLIAMMGDTYGEIKESSVEQWHRCYAQIIMSIEGEMDWSSKQKNDKHKYWIDLKGERYLQVVEKNDEYVDEMKTYVEENYNTGGPKTLADILNGEAAFAAADVNDDQMISKREFIQWASGTQDQIKDYYASKLTETINNAKTHRGSFRAQKAVSMEELGPQG